MRVQGRLQFLVAAAFMAVFVLVAALSPSQTADAAQITSRSLTLQAGVSDGGSKPGGVVNHLFSFTVPTTGSVGSIKFEYCTIAVGTCVKPTGLSTTSATMGSQAGATGFTLDATTDGAPFITRTAASITGGQAVSYQLLGVTNPTATNTSFFVRISTYASINTTGGVTDSGIVSASTATQITLTGTMPESLIFCTGATVGTVSSVPDCSTATAGAINFNQLFSPTDTATASSQMAASTNASSGYAITVNGVTLTSGSNTITALGSATAGAVGSGQFGMNLRANTTTSSNPAVGSDVAPTANGSNLRGQADAGYNTVDVFKFVSGDMVADSSNGGAGPTDAQIFTATYIVNVPGSQTAGTYTTTLTYICTPTF